MQERPCGARAARSIHASLVGMEPNFSRGGDVCLLDVTTPSPARIVWDIFRPVLVSLRVLASRQQPPTDLSFMLVLRMISSHHYYCTIMPTFAMLYPVTICSKLERKSEYPLRPNDHSRRVECIPTVLLKSVGPVAHFNSCPGATPSTRWCW